MAVFVCKFVHRPVCQNFLNNIHAWWQVIFFFSCKSFWFFGLDRILLLILLLCSFCSRARASCWRFVVPPKQIDLFVPGPFAGFPIDRAKNAEIYDNQDPPPPSPPLARCYLWSTSILGSCSLQQAILSQADKVSPHLGVFLQPTRTWPISGCITKVL